MKEKVVLAFSGGQDSTTCLAWALSQGYDVYPVTIAYGQRHGLELAAAGAIVRLAGLSEKWECVSLPGVLKSTSPLVDHSAKVGLYKDAASLPGGLEATFVPARNILFLTILANRAVALGARKLVIGVSEEDYGGYYDCREEFIGEMEHALSLGCFGEADALQILAPLIHLTKRQTVDLAWNLRTMGVPCFKLLAHSHTCYNGSYPPCGKCHACLLRAKGFDEAGLPDPLMDRVRYEEAGPDNASDDGVLQ